MHALTAEKKPPRSLPQNSPAAEGQSQGGRAPASEWSSAVCMQLSLPDRSDTAYRATVFDAGSQGPADKELPPPDALITFVSDKHPSLRNAADPGKPLALPHRSFEALVSLSAACIPARQLGCLMSAGSRHVLCCISPPLTDRLACRCSS